MIREALGDASGGGNDEYVHVAVVFAGERDHAAVGREYGIRFVAGAGSEVNGIAAFAGDAPEIAGERENNVVFAERGVLGEDIVVRGEAVCASEKSQRGKQSVFHWVLPEEHTMLSERCSPRSDRKIILDIQVR